MLSTPIRLQIPPQHTTTPPPREPVDLQPASTYEAITRQMVEALANDMKEVKSRTNNIFYVVIGSILIDMLTRWMGG